LYNLSQIGNVMGLLSKSINLIPFISRKKVYVYIFKQQICTLVILPIPTVIPHRRNVLETNTSKKLKKKRKYPKRSCKRYSLWFKRCFVHTKI